MGTHYLLSTTLAGGATLAPFLEHEPTWLHRSMAIGLGLFGLGLLCLSFSQRRSLIEPLSSWGKEAFASLAESLKSSPSVRFLLLIGTAFACFAVAASMMNWQLAGTIFYGSAAATLFGAGAADVCQIVGRILKKVWIPMAGKLLAVTVGVALACCALALAKHATHSINGIDPKHFTEFITVFTAVLLPLVYSLAAAATITLFAIAQWITLLLVLAFVALSGNAEKFAGERARLRLSAWRGVILEKLSPEPADSKLAKARLHDVAPMMRPFAVMTCAFALATGCAFLMGLWPTAKPHVTRLLVALEYREHSACRNTADLPVAYLDDNNISIAKRVGQEYRFEVIPCELLQK